MHIHHPALVLLPDTFLSAADGYHHDSGKRPVAVSMLVDSIQEEFPGLQIEPVGRKYWNDTGGQLPITSLHQILHPPRTQVWSSFSNYALRMKNVLEQFSPYRISAHTLIFTSFLIIPDSVSKDIMHSQQLVPYSSMQRLG